MEQDKLATPNSKLTYSTGAAPRPWPGTSTLLSSSDGKPSWMGARFIQHLLTRPYLPVASLCILCLMVWWPRHFLGSSKTAGEAFESYHAGLNLHRFGWKWAGIQDQATGAHEAAHPYFYLHHPSFGNYFSYLLFCVGIESLEWQNALAGLGFLAGIVLAYLFLCQVTASRFVASLCLLFLCLDFASILNWVFNLNRAFSYLAVCGALYTYHGCENSRFRNWRWLAGFLAAIVFLLGTDYMFFFFIGAAITLWELCFPETDRTLGQRIRGVFMIASVFGCAFTLRQMQIVAGAGPYIWFNDFRFQVLNRFSFEWLFGPNWLMERNQFYSENCILNPGFPLAYSWSERLSSFLLATGKGLASYVLHCEWGSDQFWRVIGAGLLAANLMMGLTCLRRRWGAACVRSNWARLLALTGLLALSGGLCYSTCQHALAAEVPGALALIGIVMSVALAGTCVVLSISLMRRPLPELASTEPIVRLNRLGLVLLFSCLVMYTAFPTYFVHWLPFFNLIALCVILWTVALLLPLFQAWAQSSGRTAAVLWVLAGQKCCLAVLAMLALPPQPADYADALRSVKGKIAACNFTAASVASFTHNYAATLTSEGIGKALQLEPLTRADFWLYCERDKDNPLHVAPSYLMYFTQFGVHRVPDEVLHSAKARLVRRGESYLLFDLEK